MWWQNNKVTAMMTGWTESEEHVRLAAQYHRRWQKIPISLSSYWLLRLSKTNHGHFHWKIPSVLIKTCGLGSSVSIATGYGLDDPGIESPWGRDFLHTSRRALRPTQPPVQWVPGLSWGVKWPGHGADHPPLPSTEVENEYNYTSIPPLGPWWPVIGWTLPLPF
jgi:hypothetical protein